MHKHTIGRPHTNSFVKRARHNPSTQKHSKLTATPAHENTSTVKIHKTHLTKLPIYLQSKLKTDKSKL